MFISCFWAGVTDGIFNVADLSLVKVKLSVNHSQRLVVVRRLIHEILNAPEDVKYYEQVRSNSTCIQRGLADTSHLYSSRDENETF